MFTTGRLKVKTKEIINIIENLNLKKASASDKITDKIIKLLPENIKDISNKILEKIKFLDHWKTEETILIHKPNKLKNKSENYRPITLLNHLS